MSTENKTIEKCIEIAEKLEWSVEHEDDYGCLDFAWSSRYGQDFHMTVVVVDNEPETLVDAIDEYINSFDVSEEAYLWLDDTGHGRNGAPYNMKDVYEDMEDCLCKMEELHSELLLYIYK